MHVWFDATHAKCAAVVEMKLVLYEAACDTLASVSVGGSAGVEGMGEFMEKMQLTEPLTAPKTAGFLDEIEEKLHSVFGLLKNGYTLEENDKAAFGKMKFTHTVANSVPASTTTGLEREMSSHPELYGELTSKGVRQLHQIVLQCCERAGVIVHARTEECTQQEPQCDRSKEDKTVSSSRPHHQHAFLAVDVGSGVGKLLFEWSLLTRRDASGCSRCCRCTWTHVGLELAPSRMCVARRAMCDSRSLLYCPENQRWIVVSPHDDTDGTHIVLGEADVFAEGLLSNDTFLPIVEAMEPHGDCCVSDGDSNNSESHNGTSHHLVLFCCGLGFGETAVRELCAALERMWLTPRDSSSSSSLPPWRTLTCVLLLRPFPGVQTFPLFRLCMGPTRQHDAGGVFCTRTHLETTWMSEAPAWVLSLFSSTSGANR